MAPPLLGDCLQAADSWLPLCFDMRLFALGIRSPSLFAGWHECVNGVSGCTAVIALFKVGLVIAVAEKAVTGDQEDDIDIFDMEDRRLIWHNPIRLVIKVPCRQ